MPQYPVVRREVHHVEKRFVAPDPEPRPYLSPEMAEREARAQEHFRQLQSRIGPSFNKGPLQLLTDSELAAEKRGELRRRS